MRRHPLIASTVAAGMLTAACGSNESDADGSGDTPTIAVTTTLLGDVVAQLTGDLAAVEVIMPVNADPHEFQPSARQVAALRDADVVVVNGGDFEEGLVDTIHSAEEDGAVVFEALDHVAPLEVTADDDHAEDDHTADDDHTDDDHPEDDHAEDDHTDDDGDDHGHDGDDPHFFTDPARMAVAADALSELLADEVPALDTDEFRDRAAAYVADLEALDGEMEAVLDVVPAERRKLVTNHEVFTYFADRYEFEVVGAIVPSASTQAAPSAAAISDLADTVAAEGVPAVFADTSSPESLADTLAEEVGDVEVVELFSESLGDEGSGADTYVGMVRTNATRIAEALAP